jgi:DNA-directed RNA polymerase specialized sigma24 family protein
MLILPINEKISDQQLLQLFLQGDVKAFDLFYDKHAKKMLNFTIRRMNYNKADADDVHACVWEKFLKILLDNERGREVFIKKIFHSDRNKTDSAVPYLQTMLKNKIIDFYRAKERKKEDFFEDQYTGNNKRPLNTFLYEIKSEEGIEAIELEMTVYQSIYRPVLNIKKTINEFSYQQDKQKKLMAQEKKEEKKATILYKTFIMRMAGFNYNEISLELCIDRKTLQKIRGDYNKILGEYVVTK